MNGAVTTECPSWARLRGGASRRRILFVSYHCLLDPSSGAEVSAIDLLELLGSRGWDVRAFCGPLLDSPGHGPISRRLADQGVDFHSRRAPAAFPPVGVLHFRRGRVPGMVFEPSSSGPDVASDDAQAFLALYQRLLDRLRPDVLVTYGGQWLASEVMRCAQQRGTRVVFWLRNFAYRDARLFDAVDGVLVPSQFSSDHYRRVLGLRCSAIPPPLDWSKIRCQPAAGQKYVTFVNPHPTKGVRLFAAIAARLQRCRPEIPLLVVEGRGGADSLAATSLDLRELTNLYAMGNTPDPRHFYRVSRMLLVPSLWRESFGRVAAEAMVNGIPVLASDRGGLPETLRDAGFLFHVPDHYTPDSRFAPSDCELEPWVQTIIRLWDDESYYRRERARCLRAADEWRPRQLAARYDDYFRTLMTDQQGESSFSREKRISKS